MYDLFKDFAGPIATVIASIAAVSVTTYFAWHQKRLAKKKLRLDLFERRWAVLQSAHDYYSAACSWQDTPEQHAAEIRFSNACRVSKFLFASENGVEGILKDINSAAEKMIGLKITMKSSGSNYELHKACSTELTELNGTLPDQLSKLTKAMSNYLDFQNL
jgi:hypothetical protein